MSLLLCLSRPSPNSEKFNTSHILTRIFKHPSTSVPWINNHLLNTSVISRCLTHFLVLVFSLLLHTEPRGFGFIHYLDPAKYQMDGQVFQGRSLTLVFAEENRKKPQEMRARERGRDGRFYDRRGTPPRYHNSPRYSRSPPPSGRDYYSPPQRRQYSRSISPEERRRYSRERSYSPRDGRGRSYSQSPPPREQCPPFNGSRSRSQSPVREHSPPYKGSRSRSRSPVRARSPVRGHSRSPDAVHYSRNPDRDVSQGR